MLFGKLIFSNNQISDLLDEITEESWLNNEMYSLKKEDQHILLSKDAWLNDRIMDAAQKLICKEIGNELSYKSVLNFQNKVVDPFHPVSQGHLKLLMTEPIIGFSHFGPKDVYKYVIAFVQV